MADLRKEELFPADAFGLFYLQITRIPGGWRTAMQSMRSSTTCIANSPQRFLTALSEL